MEKYENSTCFVVVHQPPPPPPPPRLAAYNPILTLSYASMASIVVCLLSAGYIVFTFVSPAYNRRKSRRDYQTIGGAEAVTGTATATTPNGDGRRATASSTATGGGGNASVQAGGALGDSGENQGPQGVGGVAGGGWRPYGSTDEAPAGVGCLPPSAR